MPGHRIVIFYTIYTLVTILHYAGLAPGGWISYNEVTFELFCYNLISIKGEFSIMAHSTKHDLSEALRHLLSDRPLDKITVQDIADTAGVSRKTFYYHFQDVYDLLEWMLEQDRARLEPDISDRNAWRTAVANMLDFFQKNQAMVQNLFRSIDRDTLDRYTYSILLKSLKDYARSQALEHNLTEKQYEALLQFTAHGLQGILLTWVDGGMRLPAAELLETVDTIFTLREHYPSNKHF